MQTAIGTIRVRHSDGGYNTGSPSSFRVERFEVREIRGRKQAWWYGVETGFSSYVEACERAQELRAQAVIGHGVESAIGQAAEVGR
jgi:hypothetical protein